MPLPFSFLMLPPPPRSTLFPYTTLFRSQRAIHRSQGSRIRRRALRRRPPFLQQRRRGQLDRKSTRLNSSHRCISYAVFCLKKKIPERLVDQRLVGIDITRDEAELFEINT